MSNNAFTLTDIQKIAFAAEFDDKAGNPTTVNTVPVWASSDVTVLAPDPAFPADPTGLSAGFIATGKLGTAQVSCTDTPSDGSAPIVGLADITVTTSAAVSANLKGTVS